MGAPFEPVESARDCDRVCVRTRRTLEAAGTERVHLSVFCAEAGGSVAIPECFRCVACEGADAADGIPTAILCHQSVRQDAKTIDATDALRAPIYRVARPDVVAVRATAPWQVAAEAMRLARSEAVVIVDGDDRPLGVVRASVLLLRESAHNAAVGFDAQGPRDGVPERSALQVAVGWMAQVGATLAPVVNDAGTLVGTISAEDVVRWVAGLEGFDLEPSDRR